MEEFDKINFKYPVPELNNIELRQNQINVKLLVAYDKTGGFTKARKSVKPSTQSSKNLKHNYGRVISNITDPRFSLFKELRPHSGARISNKIDIPEFIQQNFSKNPQQIDSTIKLLDKGINPHALKLAQRIH